MAAIQLTRLKQQVAGLVDFFDQPVRFRRELRDLFEFYSDRTYRPGQAGPLPPLLPNYHIATPVIRQIEMDLLPLVGSDPAAALLLVDELWEDPYLEPRLLAVYLFSLAPADFPDPLVERLMRWAKPDEDRQVLTALLTQGSIRLQREQPEVWAGLIKAWLEASDLAIQSYGLRAIQAMINDPHYENLPDIFRLISPLMQTIPPKLQADMASLVEATSRRWPTETAFFLRQMLSISHGSGVARITRRCLPLFDSGLQVSLRGAMQAQADRQVTKE